MSEKHDGNNIASSYFNKALQLLGITPGSTGGSLKDPVKVVFKNKEDRDAYLRFMQSDPEKNKDFPLELNSYNIEEIVITPEKPLVIEPEPDGKPAIVNIGTLTMKSGGQILCNTNAFVTVGEFIKN